MPSLKKLFFSKKNKHQTHHKFHEFQGYDNLRNFSTNSANFYLAPPHLGHNQQPTIQHNHQLHHLAQQPLAPPHPFAHNNMNNLNNNTNQRHPHQQLQQSQPQTQQLHEHQTYNPQQQFQSINGHLNGQQFPQQQHQHQQHQPSNPQQTIVSQPLVANQPPPPPPCQCQQCSIQSSPINGAATHSQHTYQNQMVALPHQQVATTNPPINSINFQPQQQQIFPPQLQQQQQQHSSPSLHQVNQQHQHASQMTPHHTMQRQPAQNSPMMQQQQQQSQHPLPSEQAPLIAFSNGMNTNPHQQQQQQQPQHFSTPLQSTMAPTCACQQCPYQQQLMQHQQQHHHHQPIYAGQPMQPAEVTPMNGTCQHQQMASPMQSNGLHPNFYQQYHTMRHPTQHQQREPMQNQQVQALNDQDAHQVQAAPAILQSITPSMQQQQHQFQCHTIQPRQYQQQQQQYHQRVQSLHQQPIAALSQAPHQQMEQTVSAQSQHQLHNLPSEWLADPSESTLESARYANWKTMQSLRDDSLPKSNGQLNGGHPHHNNNSKSVDTQTKFQEHVYCNQTKGSFPLPPYLNPPDYETFMERRNAFVHGLDGRQHMTHNSELMVWKRKDSSYENLVSPPYSNLDMAKQESGLTT